MLNPKELFKKTISLVLGVLIISFALSFWVVAWTEPVQNPPEGNASSSLNVGGAGQTKQGWLATLESLWVGVEPGDGEGRLYSGVLRVLNGALINNNGAPNGLIVAQGNVGIGTLSPSSGSRMEVNGNIKLTGNTPAFKITNVADPTDAFDVATKNYVDNQTIVGSGLQCDIAKNTITLSFGQGTVWSVSCDSDEVAVSGGVSCGGGVCPFLLFNNVFLTSYPDDSNVRTWTCSAFNSALLGDKTIACVARCCKVSI